MYIVIYKFTTKSFLLFLYAHIKIKTLKPIRHLCDDNNFKKKIFVTMTINTKIKSRLDDKTCKITTR